MVTVYCQEPCDDLDDITADAYFNATINTTDKKEGSGSLQVSNLAQSGTAKYVVFDALTVFPTGKKILGFWVRNPARNTSQGGCFRWRDTVTGNMAQLTWVYQDGRYQWWIHFSGYTVDLIDPFTDNDRWYYVELEYTHKDLQTVYLDGVAKHTWANFNKVMGATCDVNFYVIGGTYNMGTFRLDMIRCMDEQQYPPDYLAKKLHPFWKLNP